MGLQVSHAARSAVFVYRRSTHGSVCIHHEALLLVFVFLNTSIGMEKWRVPRVNSSLLRLRIVINLLFVEILQSIR